MLISTYNFIKSVKISVVLCLKGMKRWWDCLRINKKLFQQFRYIVCISTIEIENVAYRTNFLGNDGEGSTRKLGALA